MTQRDERKLARESKKSPFKTANQLRRDCNLQFYDSVDTVKRSLRRISARKPCLNARQKRMRFEWCKGKRNWNSSDWSNVIFSDDCKLDLHSGKRQYVRRNTGERFKQKYITCLLYTSDAADE